jgi:hypothetical protein
MEILLLLALGAVGVFIYTQGTGSGGKEGEAGKGEAPAPALPSYVKPTNWGSSEVDVQHIAPGTENTNVKNALVYYVGAAGTMTDDGKVAVTGTYTATPQPADLTVGRVINQQLDSLGRDTNSIIMSLSDVAAILDTKAFPPKTVTVFIVPNLTVPKFAAVGSGFVVVD